MIEYVERAKAPMNDRPRLYDENGTQIRLAQPEDWQTIDMPDGHAVITGERLPELLVSAEEMERMRWGVVPQQMEDRWFIYAEGNRFHFHRSWTGFCIYIADFQPVAGGHQLASLTINRDPGQYGEQDDRYEALLFRYLVDLLLLDRESEFPERPGDSDETSALRMWSSAGGTAIGQ
jgi:hypothetical protein